MAVGLRKPLFNLVDVVLLFGVEKRQRLADIGKVARLGGNAFCRLLGSLAGR
jgi:hypothetical protein